MFLNFSCSLHVALYIMERTSKEDLCSVVFTFNLTCIKRLAKYWQQTLFSKNGILCVGEFCCSLIFFLHFFSQMSAFIQAHNITTFQLLFNVCTFTLAIKKISFTAANCQTKLVRLTGKAGRFWLVCQLFHYICCMCFKVGRFVQSKLKFTALCMFYFRSKPGIFYKSSAISEGKTAISASLVFQIIKKFCPKLL